MSGKKPQDQERELELVALFDLQRTNDNRIGVDAEDEYGNTYELKTTTKAGVSTARDVGLNHLAKWRSLYWICSKGQYDTDGIFHFDETYLLFPEDLEGWFGNIEAKLRSTESLCERVLAFLRERHFGLSDLERLRYLLKRGVLLNDPNIPWTYITAHGRPIVNHHAQRLRELISERQQSVRLPVVEATIDFLFD